MSLEDLNNYTDNINRLNYSSLDDGFIDSHRCGTAPFVPDVSGPIQNSCGSYCSGFDKKTGCNKYRPNYPDDYYILNYVDKHGTCDGLQDCKNGVPPAVLSNESIGPTSVPYIVENFGMMPSGGLWTVIYIVFLFLLAKMIFGKK